jgi:hypothetical protein
MIFMAKKQFARKATANLHLFRHAGIFLSFAECLSGEKLNPWCYQLFH